MTRVLMTILLLACGAGIAKADCVYNGQVYGFGQRNAIGQICDDQSGYGR